MREKSPERGESFRNIEGADEEPHARVSQNSASLFFKKLPSI